MIGGWHVGPASLIQHPGGNIREVWMVGMSDDCVASAISAGARGRWTQIEMIWRGDFGWNGGGRIPEIYRARQRRAGTGIGIGSNGATDVVVRVHDDGVGWAVGEGDGGSGRGPGMDGRRCRGRRQADRWAGRARAYHIGNG
jgi:hypothetical protein